MVTFRLKDDSDFTVYHLSARLREHGWIVPAYSLPPNAEDVHLMRVVVRLDLSRQMIDMLIRDIEDACAHLSEEKPGMRKHASPDLWTAPALMAAHQKARTGQRRD